MSKPKKKIPRAIKSEILMELMKINKDINKAIESILSENSRFKQAQNKSLDESKPSKAVSHANSRKRSDNEMIPGVPKMPDPKAEYNVIKTSDKELANKLWLFLRHKVQNVVDQAIEDAKRGYR